MPNDCLGSSLSSSFLVGSFMIILKHTIWTTLNILESFYYIMIDTQIHYSTLSSPLGA